MDPSLDQQPPVDPQLDDEQAETQASAVDTNKADTKEEPTSSGYPEEVEKALLALDELFSKEDEGIRNQWLAFWKKLDNYFNGIQRIFWDFDAESWRGIDEENLDPSMYDKIINVYRAHGEAIIAALSVKLPNVAFYPDDADVTEDIDTAKAYSKVSELISKHNQGLLLFIRALFILYNQGVCAAYIYNRSKSEYGTIQVPEYGEDVEVTTHTLTCPVCRGFIRSFETKAPAQVENAQPISDPTQQGAPPAQAEPQAQQGFSQQQQPMPEPQGQAISPQAQPPAQEIPQAQGQIELCPNCGAEVEPEDEAIDEKFPQIVGYNEQSKSRTIIDVFGPMYAHMPFYARKQEHMPYVRLRFEQHFSLLKAIYPNIKDKISGATDAQSYDREVRAYNNLDDVYTKNLVTSTCAWYRPWAFEVLDDDSAKLLHETFPDGVYFVRLKDLVAEARPEKLDEHWEITNNPLSNYIHADPIGKPMAPIQEIRNELTDLALDTFEHSIPETFVDADVLDFTKYGTSTAKPGMKYQVKKPMGGTIKDSFYSDKPASMSTEMIEYRKTLDQDGQFVLGSFPSIYGGPATSGSKTAKEYTESRAMALQRLNTTWSMLKHWWAGVMSKAVPLFVEALVEDEKYVMREGNTGFLNVWIRQAELTGKVGRVEPEANEELPASFSQYKQILMELMGMQNDQINAAIFNPANTGNVAKVLGWPDFHIPGQDDRDKQYGEIADMLQGIDVMPEVGVDDDMVHIQICRSWCVSPTGIATKKQNSEGYMKVVAHGQAHLENQYKMNEGNGLTPAGQPTPSNTDSAVQ